MSGENHKALGEGNLRINLHSESLALLAERALLWERTGTLVVADPHFGKAAAFRAAAIPLPGGTTSETLSRLSTALGRGNARRLLVLGDFFHARSGRAPGTLAAIAGWRERHADLEVVLVRGNHDRGAGDPPREWRFDCHDEPWIEAPFAFRHHPDAEASGYVLAGHVHPAISIAGLGRQRERLPCFLFGARVGLLPAFGDFTGTAAVRPLPGDRVYGVAGEDVIQISAR